MPLFSTIIPVFNRAQFLAATVRSALAQECGDQEVIVVDDGSTDGSIALLDQFGDRVRLVTQGNRGPGAARNLGAATARADYLAFLDSDDLWFPWTLSSYAEVIRQHAHPGLLAASMVEFVDEAGVAGVLGAPVRAERYADYLAASDRCPYVGAGMSVIRRDVYLASGGFSSAVSVAEDHDLVLRLGTVRGFSQVVSPATVAWRRHPGSISCGVHSAYLGQEYLLDQESRGRYPGGSTRAHQRHRVLARHASSASLNCFRSGDFVGGWRLYRRTFRWNVRLGRLRYLLAAPLIGLARLLRARRRAPPNSPRR